MTEHARRLDVRHLLGKSLMADHFVKVMREDVELTTSGVLGIPEFGFLILLQASADWKTGICEMSMEALAQKFDSTKPTIRGYLDKLKKEGLVVDLRKSVSDSPRILVDGFQIIVGDYKGKWTSLAALEEEGIAYVPERKSWRERLKSGEELAEEAETASEDDGEAERNLPDECKDSFQVDGKNLSGGCKESFRGAERILPEGGKNFPGGRKDSFHSYKEGEFGEVLDLRETTRQDGWEFPEQGISAPGKGNDNGKSNGNGNGKSKDKPRLLPHGTDHRYRRSPTTHPGTTTTTSGAASYRIQKAPTKPASAPASEPATQTYETEEVDGVEVLKDPTGKMSIYARYHAIQPKEKPFETNLRFEVPPGVNPVDGDPDWDRLRELAIHMREIDGGVSGKFETYTTKLAPLLKIQHTTDKRNMLVLNTAMLKKMLSHVWQKNTFVQNARRPAALIGSDPQGYWQEFKGDWLKWHSREDDDEAEEYYLDSGTEDAEKLNRQYNLDGDFASDGRFRDEKGNYTDPFPLYPEEKADTRHWRHKYPRELLPLLYKEKLALRNKETGNA